MYYTKTRGEKFFDVVIVMLIVCFLFFCLYPLINIVALSFDSGIDAGKGGVTVYPRQPSFANYIMVFVLNQLTKAYLITIARTVAATLFSITVTALAAFAMSEPGIPGRKGINIFFLITMFFSGGVIPLFLVIRGTGLYNTFWVYLIPGAFNVFNYFVMKTTFKNVPLSLKEAIRIDGGNEFTVFRKAVLPLSVPTLAALSLFVAVGAWNDWFSGSYYVQNQNLIPLQSYLMQIMNQNISNMLPMLASNPFLAAHIQAVTSVTFKCAAVVVGAAPIIIIYPFMQRFFTKGLLIGSIKE